MFFFPYEDPRCGGWPGSFYIAALPRMPGCDETLCELFVCDDRAGFFVPTLVRLAVARSSIHVIS